jgi:lipopolysaccharide transport system permease protein
MAADLLPSTDYFQRVYQMRYFWWSLVINDLKARYRHSFLGIAWSLGRPLFMTVVLSVVFAKLINTPIHEYAPFVFLSMALWQFLTETMLTGCPAFRLGGPYIRQQPLPLAIFPLRTVLGTSIHAALALAVALIIIIGFLGVPNPLLVLSAVPGLVLIFLAAFALATIFGVLHTHFPDTQHLVDITLQALFYITPIMYPVYMAESRGRLKILIYCNPFTSLLEMVRAPLLAGELPSLLHVAVAVPFVLLLCALAWLCLRRVEKSLVYWVV